MNIIKPNWRKPRIYPDARKWIWFKEAMAFKKWLSKKKKYPVKHTANKPPLVFSYQETSSSPVITVENHPEDKRKCLVHVLGNDHLSEFFSKPTTIEQKSNRMTVDFYRSYMKSDQWRERSLRCFAMADSECEVCGNAEDLNAHHYNYVNLGSELHDDLFCLCKTCHRAYHKKFDAKSLPQDRHVPRLNRLRHIQTTVLSQLK